MSERRKGETPNVPSPALTRAMRQLLRPVVGLLLDNGLTYTWLTRVLKRIFVDVAESEFGIEDRQVTDSRISLVTGVHRRDVSQIRNEDTDTYEPPASIFLGPKLISIWISENRFLDENGQPASLPRSRSNAKTKGLGSFEELVTLIRTDIRPRSVLDELLRLGIVKIDDDDFVSLIYDAFVPSQGVEEKMYYLGRNLRDHIAASRDNVKSAKPPFFERSVYYDGLSDASVEQLADISRRKGAKLLRELNTQARKLQQRDEKDPDARFRMNFGSYFYSDDQ